MIEGQIFTHEYHQISGNSVSRFSLKKNFVETSDGFKKTVQNQKHPGRLMKKSVRWYSFENFFHHVPMVFLIRNSFFDGFKKTVQNQKHPGRLMKKSVRWYSFENFCSSRT